MKKKTKPLRLFLGRDAAWVLSKHPLVDDLDAGAVSDTYDGHFISTDKRGLVDLGYGPILDKMFAPLKLKHMEVVELEVRVVRRGLAKPAKGTKRQRRTLVT